MMRGGRRLLAAVVLVCVSVTLGFAQGSGQSLSGIVVDAGGGVIPGAAVVVKNNATGETFELTTNEAGAFSVPAIAVGTYAVTVTLQGFKTAIVNDIRVVTATPASIKATLEVGALSESVEVRAGSELVQTQSTTVTASINVEQISNLPLASRNALYFAAMLPGVETTGGPRGSTFSGLPNNTINVTIDGVTTGNQLQSTDGFFSMVTPRLDAVEEVTVTGATGSANSGPGAVQIAFTTRSGTNQFNNSIYHYFKHPNLNSNYYFNKINGLEKNQVIVHQYGGRSGGPIIIPGLFDGRNKAFYFFNFEHFHQPNEATRTRVILNPEAERGIFSYLSASGGTQTVNLFDLARRANQTSTMDPTIAALLGQIRSATGATGSVITPPNATNTQNYIFQASSRGNQYAPTGRVDINVTDAHRLTGTYWWQRFLAKPDLLNNAEAVFPGFPSESFQTSYRTTGSVGLRSTLGPSLVNEVKGGWQWSPNAFYTNVVPSMFQNQDGFRLDFPLIADPAVAAHNNPAPRNTVNWNIDNTLNWLKGRHSVSVGGSFLQLTHNQEGWNLVPTLGFGVDQTNDPANAFFNTVNFPGASTATLTDARNIYAILTGRVTSITGNARVDSSTGEYVYLGNLLERSRMNSFALFAQDSWRWTPTLTLNYGLRWDLQLPFKPLSNAWSRAALEDLCGVSGVGSGPQGQSCNLFQPGTLGGGAGLVPDYEPFTPGTTGFETDWNNFAPNVGVAWRPNVQGGFLRTLLGDPEQATIRAGYSLSYNLERLDRFTGLYGDNPGGEIAATRNYTTGFPMVRPGESTPVLFRDRARLGPPAFPTAPSYPIAAVPSNELNIFDPSLRTPYVQSFSVGLQRMLDRDTAIEVRYVGNRNHQTWTTEDWNEEVLFENGFIDEFKIAQANLAAHVTQGCTASGTCSFAYRGPGTGTAPLPIYLAYFQGLPQSRANDASAYTSGNFRNSAWTGHLGYYEPDPDDAANDLHANLTFRANALAAGLPPNFFEMNPGVSQANITRGLAGTRYHAGQIELRRRLAQGFMVTANYTYARKFETNNRSLRLPRIYLNDTDVNHSFKTNWIWEVPIGKGRRIGTNMNALANALVGNWEFSGTGRLQTTQYATTEGRLVGMTLDELQGAFEIRTERSASGTITVWSFPQDIVENTRRAFNSDPTSPTGYGAEGPPIGRYIAPLSDPSCLSVYIGDCAREQLRLTGPLFSRFDMRLKKRFPFARKAYVELDFEIQNVFDSPNFNHAFDLTPNAPLTASDVFRVTSAYTDINTTFDPGGRLGQIVWRVSW
jgi:Carboxypeptidase regulatory-like domain/TonB dependent receptor-like, beta-barrel